MGGGGHFYPLLKGPRVNIFILFFRHLVFYTDEQAALLKKARTTYLDGTFKIVRKPFCQLFSIHVFIKKGQAMKQIPVAFVLMSKKRAVDYEYIMSAIKDLLEVNMCFWTYRV